MKKAIIRDPEAAWQATKEFLRLVVFAGIGAGLAAAGAATNLLPDPWMAVGVASLVATLGKAWDKYTHENAYDNKDGVLPF